MKQLAFDFARPPRPTLENFIPGENAELLRTLRDVAAGISAERFIYVWGAPGCGRSHLLGGMVAAFRATGRTASYIDCARERVLAENLGALDCVAADNVERLDNEAQIALFHLYNALRERRAALIAAGDAPPVELKLRKDLVTRFGWGLVYRVHTLSDEEKAQALRRHAAVRGFALPDEVCQYLLTHARRDMLSLLALLGDLDRYSLETKRAVTVALARELLRSTPTPTLPLAEGAND